MSEANPAGRASASEPHGDGVRGRSPRETQLSEAKPAGTDDERRIVLAGHAGDEATARSALADTEPRHRSAALGALARCGRLTGADLIAALADSAPAVRRRAADEAARLADPATGPALLELLDDADPTVVEAAAHALGELDTPPAGGVDAIADRLGHDTAVVVRETAVAALGSIGTLDALPAVLAATTDVATVRRRAVLALAAFEGQEVEAALQRLAGDRDRQVRQAAEDLLHDWGRS